MVFVGLLALVWFLHTAIRQNTFSFVQPVLWLAVFLSFAAPQRRIWLVLLTVLAELFSSLPPGALLTAVWLPLVIRKLFPKIDIDLSFSFLLLLVGIVAAQLLSLAAFDQWLLWRGAEISLSDWVGTLPVLGVMFSLIGTAVMAYVSLIAWRQAI